MKFALLALASLLLSLTHAFSGNWFGPGPWANATYFPGNLDGKYQASVFGNNISGVLGFALRDGAPTTTVTSQLNTTNNSSQSTLTVDPFQNYFVIFVEGRTYSGLTTAGVNYNNNTVTGALLGTQPDFQLITNTFNTFTTNFVVESLGSSLILVPVTNVVPSIRVIGQSNIITTNTVAITNIFTTNLSVIETNILVGVKTILQTNTNTGQVTETNIPFVTTTFSTNFLIATNIETLAPTITTNTVDILATNFRTNITFEIAGESNTLVTNERITTLTNPYTWYDPTPLLNRGLSGGYRANINSKGSVFTFSGNGQLSTPSQVQTINLTTNSRGDVTAAQIQTATVPFQLNGIRVSFSSASTSASANGNNTAQ